MTSPARVLVLGGGPDAEREVSLRSAAAVAEALKATHAVHHAVIDRVTREELAAMPGDVVFPVLHGAYGEGGELQDILESLGRPYVGCRPPAARLAMDKMATKLAAARAGVLTAPAQIVAPGSARLALTAPLVIKPVHEGSSVGLALCHTGQDVDASLRRITPDKVWMAESMIKGRELTVGLLGDPGKGLAALPIVEIRPASGVYDYEAKYTRGDTVYTVAPELPAGLTAEIQRRALRVAEAIGVRHLCRVDFILAPDGKAYLLEVNTMPGFTATSLLPKAAAAAGLTFPALCDRLVRLTQASG